ncbi:MAG TPA: EF-P lysine aminoacylase GenX, partial [Gammaproteobacteria bacterium]|nr:EF-P lysine aminoacylase GenX [Gammaproteobacteria bacterium]
MSWQPAAPVDALPARARMLHSIRAFFMARDVLEVETPALSHAANTDPAIASLETRVMSSRCFLHTSPEFPMKRLLAAGSGDIYQICKVFRDGESGRYHNPEFTLLEWYRTGFDEHALIDEVLALIRLLAGEDLDSVKMTYRELFQQSLGIDPQR